MAHVQGGVEYSNGDYIASLADIYVSPGDRGARVTRTLYVTVSLRNLSSRPRSRFGLHKRSWCDGTERLRAAGDGMRLTNLNVRRVSGQKIIGKPKSKRTRGVNEQLNIAL